MQHSNRDRALQVIDGITSDWERVQDLAKQARLTVRSMARYLAQAKKARLVENRTLDGRYGSHICEWRRKEGSQ